jgi:hypothetical protein
MTLNFTPKYPIGTIIWYVDHPRQKVVGFKIAKIKLSFDANGDVDETSISYISDEGEYLREDYCVYFVNRSDAHIELEKYIIGQIDDDILFYESQITYTQECIQGQQQELAQYLKSLQDYQKKIKGAQRKKRKMSKEKVLAKVDEKLLEEEQKMKKEVAEVEKV